MRCASVSYPPRMADSPARTVGRDQLARRAATVRTLAKAGVLRPQRPDRLIHAGLQLLRWRTSPSAAVAVGAARYPDRDAVVDERGAVTFAELHARTNALSRGLAGTGLRTGQAVGVLCRNHRPMAEAVLAAGKLGLHVIFLNTMFSAKQLADVCEREDVHAVVHDEEFAEAVAGLPVPTYLAWVDGDPPGRTLEDLLVGRDTGEVKPPAKEGRLVILTSGTTGSPKGANRRQPSSLDPIATFLECVPLRSGQRTLVAPPLFHSWGLLTFMTGLGIGGTQVLQRRFDPEGALACVAENRCEGMVVVPLMLQRILELPDEKVARYALSSLRVIAVSGAALPGELAVRAMDRLGDVLYNFYGSTEVAWVSIATPADLRAAPGDRGPAAARHDAARSSTTRVATSGPARPGGSSSATTCSRGLHRRRRQGVARRAALHRRRRAPRPGGPALRRRPRRRHDRVRRRERLPARGRGPARRAPRRGRRGRRRRPRRPWGQCLRAVVVPPTARPGRGDVLRDHVRCTWPASRSPASRPVDELRATPPARWWHATCRRLTARTDGYGGRTPGCRRPATATGGHPVSRTAAPWRWCGAADYLTVTEAPAPLRAAGLLGLLLGDLLQDRLRGAVHEVLGLLETETRELAHLLDDLDLLVAGTLRMTSNSSCAASSSAPAAAAPPAGAAAAATGAAAVTPNVVLELLHELGELDQGHLLECSRSSSVLSFAMVAVLPSSAGQALRGAGAGMGGPVSPRWSPRPRRRASRRRPPCWLPRGWCPRWSPPRRRGRLVDGLRARCLGGWPPWYASSAAGAVEASSGSAAAGVPAPPRRTLGSCSAFCRSASRTRAVCASGAANSDTAFCSDAFIAPASFARRTSRDSRSASFLSSSGDRACRRGRRP